MTPRVKLIVLVLDDEQSALDHIVQLEHLHKLLRADQKLNILSDDVNVEYATFLSLVPVHFNRVLIIYDYSEDERKPAHSQ